MPESEDDAPEPRALLLLPELVIGSDIAQWSVAARSHAGLDSWVSLAGLTVIKGSCAAALTKGQQPRATFFSTFAPEMPLPVRLGVMRC
jgi:hypothetical protein